MEDTETSYFIMVEHSDLIYTKNKWVYVEKKVSVPANIDKINLRVGVYNNYNYSPSVTAWFDNLSIRKANNINDIEIVEENNYYPFGLKHKGYNNDIPSAFANPALKYKYNGTEYEDALGLNLYEMDFRQYDPAIARFTSVDPVSHYHQSNYSAYNNNPVYFPDPSGASDDIGDLLLKLFNNTPNDGFVYTYNGSGDQTGVSTVEEFQQEQEKKTKAKGGNLDGEYLEDNVGHKYEGGWWFPKETKGKKLDNDGFADEIDLVASQLEELKKIVSAGSKSGMGIAGLAYLIKQRTPAGLILSGSAYIASLDISEDQKELLQVALRYIKLHANKPENMQGVYRVYRKSANMIPIIGWGSDKVTIDYYDANTGQHLGGIEKGAFGF